MNYTSTVTSKGTITLPAAFRREHNIAAGTRIILHQHGDKLIIDAPINIEEVRRRTKKLLLRHGMLRPPTKTEIDAIKVKDLKKKYGL